jgi:hypothetical protein
MVEAEIIQKFSVLRVRLRWNSSKNEHWMQLQAPVAGVASPSLNQFTFNLSSSTEHA